MVVSGLPALLLGGLELVLRTTLLGLQMSGAALMSLHVPKHLTIGSFSEPKPLFHMPHAEMHLQQQGQPACRKSIKLGQRWEEG